MPVADAPELLAKLIRPSSVTVTDITADLSLIGTFSNTESTPFHPEILATVVFAVLFGIGAVRVILPRSHNIPLFLYA